MSLFTALLGLSTTGELEAESAMASLSIHASFPRFSNLTCVHVNCDDTRLLACGYKNAVSVYDIESQAVVRVYEDAHDGELINISRFANLSPNVFATSSVDRTIKLWDLRSSSGAGSRPIYTVTSARQNVTLSFRADDLQLLTAASDNEVSSMCGYPVFEVVW